MSGKLLAARSFVACRICRYLLPASLLLSSGCSGKADGPTACDGLAAKTLAITKDDYSQCAAELLSTLEALETPLRRFVNGDIAAQYEAESAGRRLRHLMRQVDFQSDVWREARGGADRPV